MKIEKAHLASNGDPLDSWLFLDEDLSSLYRLTWAFRVQCSGTRNAEDVDVDRQCMKQGVLFTVSRAISSTWQMPRSMQSVKDRVE